MRLSANRLARRGATERPAFSGWHEPARREAPVGGRVTVSCNGMLGHAPRSFSDGRRDKRNGECWCTLDTRNLLACPLDVLSGIDDDPFRRERELARLSHLEMDGATPVGGEEDVETGSEDVDGLHNEFGVGGYRRWSTPDLDVHRATSEDEKCLRKGAFMQRVLDKFRGNPIIWTCQD